ncbi:hypothetical protein [Hyphomicrobium sp. 1Nfss2.1]|uniref:hypothetical protein n=1 Tax=Hyphomicrobium sp. 1Nfss2.1 TaxID=3413936 RepID=UPI003C7D6E92
MKVLLGHVLAELARLNQSDPGTSTESWLFDLESRVVGELRNAAVQPIGERESARLTADAVSITERFFTRTRYVAAARADEESADAWLAGRLWIVPGDHPYCAGRCHAPHVYAIGGKWRIVWRTFDSMKQNEEYLTEQEAREAAKKIAERQVTASACDEDQLRQFSEYWIEAAGLPKDSHASFEFIEVT